MEPSVWMLTGNVGLKFSVFNNVSTRSFFLILSMAKSMWTSLEVCVITKWWRRNSWIIMLCYRLTSDHVNWWLMHESLEWWLLDGRSWNLNVFNCIFSLESLIQTCLNIIWHLVSPWAPTVCHSYQLDDEMLFNLCLEVLRIFSLFAHRNTTSKCNEKGK